MMKITLTFLFIVLFGTSITAQTTNNSHAVDSLLHCIYQKDQSIRHEFISHIQTNNADSIIYYSQKMNEIDNENQQIVFNLLDTTGWPTNVSDSAHTAIFLVIDHAELPAQKKYLSMMEEQATKGFVSKSNLATLQDRILMKENKKQRYGTQTKSFSELIDDEKKTSVYMWPIENPESIDSLRATIELPPIAWYLDILKQTYGHDVIWDPSLTPDEVNAKQLRETN